MSITEKQEEIILQFSKFEDWTEKYEYLIQLGKQLQEMDESEKTDLNLIRGCQAKVWLSAKKDVDKVQFSADSDTLITKGLIALIIKVLNNESAIDILKSDLYFIDRIGLKEHLNPTRSNGLLNMIKQVKLVALSTK